MKLALPVESNTLGPGDVLVVEIVGEKDLPTEYQVASDGTIDLPYVHRLKVEGLEPQRVQEVYRGRLIEKKVFTDPSIVVRVTAYNSKRVTVLGQVQEPGSFPLEPGITLVQAISLAGGLNSIADTDRVKLTRKTSDGAMTVVLSIRAIMDGRSPDIPLQAGDQIFVEDRVF
ncbi:MAG: polysaccharide export protein [Polyangiaceae bacterium]|nr:polysaccharide export protein [Polyangiaceae bacterium]